MRKSCLQNFYLLGEDIIQLIFKSIEISIEDLSCCVLLL